MKIGLQLNPSRYDVGAMAKAIEDGGMDSAWAMGGLYPVYAQMLLATERIDVGGAIIPLFQTAPMNHASNGSFLQGVSGGRFIYGMGTQTKGQIRINLGLDNPKPAKMARESLEILRALLNRTGDPLRYDGEYFSINLPSGGRFNRRTPDANDIAPPPIFFSGVNRLNLRLAGELSDGLVGHPIFPPRYIKEIVWPLVDEGLSKAGKTRADFHMTGMGLAWVADNEVDRLEGVRRAKHNLGRWLTTRAYGNFMESMGFTKERQAIQAVVNRAPYGGPFDDEALTDAISDEMCEETSMIGTVEEVIQKAKERYEGLVDTLILFTIGQEDPLEEDTVINRTQAHRLIDAFESYPR
jgi:alkanesulfonate monooxygenase SsuD/methylene tetrahydromethanopterin reductase-like flavin-dependent oxidoreductase (luciferase family)